MDDENQNLKPIPFIRDFCKGKTEEELLEAEENFRGFLLAIKEICDRLEMEGKSIEDFDE